jgi:carboxylesterase type B
MPPVPRRENVRISFCCMVAESANSTVSPVNLNFTAAVLGNEDCLFLSVYAPQKATRKLPVLIWIRESYRRSH